MITELITALKNRIIAENFIQKCYGLCQLVKVQGKQIPVNYDTAEAQHIQFDENTSLCFFLLNGAVSEQQRDNDVSGCGEWVVKKVPLRLIFFSSDNSNKNCSPIDESAVSDLIAALVFQQDLQLSGTFGLASVSMVVTSQEFRRDQVWSQVYGNTNNELQDFQQLFSIDFNLCYEGDPQCWVAPCGEVLLQENLQPILQQNNGNILL